MPTGRPEVEFTLMVFEAVYVSVGWARIHRYSSGRSLSRLRTTSTLSDVHSHCLKAACAQVDESDSVVDRRSLRRARGGYEPARDGLRFTCGESHSDRRLVCLPGRMSCQLTSSTKQV